MIETIKRLYDKTRSYCATHLVEFVETYCHIEDKDAPEIVVPFQLWSAQRDALESIQSHKLNIILKARQLGLTWLALCYAVWYMLFHPGSTVVALSRTEEEAKELVRRMGVILGSMPEFVRKSDWYGAVYTQNIMSVSIRYGGLESTLKVFPSASNAARSFTANLLILDEWAFQQYASELWQAAYPIINRPRGGQVIGLSTIKLGSLFADLWERENGFNKIFIPWSADPRRNEAWYTATRAACETDVKFRQEYPATPEEAFSSAEGRFFGELRGDIHQCSGLAGGTVRRYASIDYGLDALAGLFYEVDTSGYVVVYDELYSSGLIVSEAAAAMSTRMEGVQCVYAPPDLWNRNRDTGRSTAEIFALSGIPLVKTSNDRVQGWLDVKEWLKPIERRHEQTGETYTTARLRFLSGKTSNAWRCMTKILTDPRNPNDAAREPHELTHLPDSLRAFCAGRPIPAQEPIKHNQYQRDYADQIDDFMSYGR